jgi:hypothetical protein
MASLFVLKKQYITYIYNKLTLWYLNITNTKAKKSPYILPLHNPNIQLPLLEELYIDKDEMIDYEQINIENKYRVKMYVAIERIL